MTYRPRQPTADQVGIELDSAKWPPAAARSNKVQCPLCGTTGYPGGQWTWRHLTHFVAPCGRFVAGKLGDRRHAAKCKKCSK